jgi:hypothetical protein
MYLNGLLNSDGDHPGGGFSNAKRKAAGLWTPIPTFHLIFSSDTPHHVKPSLSLSLFLDIPFDIPSHNTLSSIITPMCLILL